MLGDSVDGWPRGWVSQRGDVGSWGFNTWSCIRITRDIGDIKTFILKKTFRWLLCRQPANYLPFHSGWGATQIEGLGPKVTNGNIEPTGSNLKLTGHESKEIWASCNLCQTSFLLNFVSKQLIFLRYWGVIPCIMNVSWNHRKLKVEGTSEIFPTPTLLCELSRPRLRGVNGLSKGHKNPGHCSFHQAILPPQVFFSILSVILLIKLCIPWV